MIWNLQCMEPARTADSMTANALNNCYNWLRVSCGTCMKLSYKEAPDLTSQCLYQVHFASWQEWNRSTHP